MAREQQAMMQQQAMMAQQAAMQQSAQPQEIPVPRLVLLQEVIPVELAVYRVPLEVLVDHGPWRVGVGPPESFWRRGWPGNSRL